MDQITKRRLLAALFATIAFIGACSSGGGDEAVEADADAATAEDDAGDAGAEGADSVPATDGTQDDAATGGETADEEGGAARGGDAETGSTTAETAPDTAPTTTASSEPAPPSSAAPAATPAPIVPRSGTYTYERTTTSDEGTETENSDQVVTRLSGDDTAARLQLEQDSSQGRITSQASAGPDGTLVESSVIESQVGEIDCDWEPDWLFVGAWVAGETWTIDTGCTDDANGLQVEVEFSGSGRVVGVETVTVRGRTLDAWVVETDLTTQASVTSPALSGSSTTESTSRAWIDPATGMSVRTESSETTSGDFGNSSSTIVSELIGIS